MTCEWWQHQDAEPKCEFFPYIFIYPYNQPSYTLRRRNRALLVYYALSSLSESHISSWSRVCSDHLISPPIATVLFVPGCDMWWAPPCRDAKPTCKSCPHHKVPSCVHLPSTITSLFLHWRPQHKTPFRNYATWRIRYIHRHSFHLISISVFQRWPPSCYCVRFFARFPFKSILLFIYLWLWHPALNSLPYALL